MDLIINAKIRLENVMLGLMKDLQAWYGMRIKYASYNNHGENEDFERVCIQEGMDVQLE